MKRTEEKNLQLKRTKTKKTTKHRYRDTNTQLQNDSDRPTTKTSSYPVFCVIDKSGNFSTISTCFALKKNFFFRMYCSELRCNVCLDFVSYGQRFFLIYLLNQNVFSGWNFFRPQLFVILLVSIKLFSVFVCVFVWEWMDFDCYRNNIFKKKNCVKYYKWNNKNFIE